MYYIFGQCSGTFLFDIVGGQAPSSILERAINLQAGGSDRNARRVGTDFACEVLKR